MGSPWPLIFGAGFVFGCYFYARSAGRRARIERRLGSAREDANAEMPGLEREVSAEPTKSRDLVIAVVAGVAAFLALWMRVGAAVSLSVALSVVIGIVAHIFISIFANRGIVKMEEQLADAVDMLAASLVAGLSSLAAVEVAARQTRPPLRPAMEAMARRLRLGEEPTEVFQEFRNAVPLHSARLLAFTLAVHWEVGGSIAPALRNVARVVRDRIDLSRRIRSQAAEAQLSVVGILFITYAVAGLMWTSNPEGARTFFQSTVGAQLAALIIALQAIGLLWMRKLAGVTS